jgi:hypothetical protein
MQKEDEEAKKASILAAEKRKANSADGPQVIDDSVPYAKKQGIYVKTHPAGCSSPNQHRHRG